MHGIGGNLVAMTIGGTAVNFKFLGARVRYSADTLDDTGPGDTGRSRLAGYHDYEVEFTGYVPDQAARHILVANEATFGTEIAFGLKQKASDTNPFFADTALLTELEIDASDHERPIGCRGRFMMSSGDIAGLWDTTPTA